MTDRERYAALAEHYLRLRSVALALLAECKPAGGDEPACAIPPHRIRDLRRELRHEPAPSGWFTMSPS
jgi:hypothetical protein